MSVYNFNYQWKFRLADAFPLKDALEATKDKNGRFFYEREYEEEGWEEVSLPHTYNDKDLFVNRIQDAGSDQKRTFSCYRKWFALPEGCRDRKVFLEFEGVRQTCYLYVNGDLAGYYEAGVAPVGFDLTPFLEKSGENLVAVATDSTSTRNLDFFGAETPNHPDAKPGSFISSLTKLDDIPPAQRGVPYFWNCNDFNPCVGGLSRNVRLYVKPRFYLTLPLYSNLKTHGTYIYATDMEIEKKEACLHVEAEVRNETGGIRQAGVEVTVLDRNGKETAVFSSFHPSGFGGSQAEEYAFIEPADPEAVRPVLTIVPKDAYRRTPDGFEALSEEEVANTEYLPVEVSKICASARVSNVRFWSLEDPYLYRVKVSLFCREEDGSVRLADTFEQEIGIRKTEYRGEEGFFLNDRQVWLTGYAQRAANEWAAIGAAVDWLKDKDAQWIRESNANHIRFMHVAGCPADIRSYDRYGVVCTQPAGDKERESFGRQWDQRVELMRDVIIYFRNHPSILFWEAGNNSIGKEHMREMRLLKEHLDPHGGRFMGCRTINTEDVVAEAEYVGTMLNRHAASFIAAKMPVTETEYSREESPRRVWDDYTPPYYDYDNRWVGRMGKKQNGGDCYDLNAEEFALKCAKSYEEFFHDRIGGASGKNLYSAAAALCWTDSAQHGRQAYSENGRMSGRVDPVRIPKQNYWVYRTMQSPVPSVHIVGHWNYPKQSENTYRYAVKEFQNGAFEKTGEYRYRNPLDKTVYVIGSYGIAKVDLIINGKTAGSCSKPKDTFVFAFPHIDVTQSGKVEAYGYGYDGSLLARDRIETAGDPAAIRLSLHTGEEGFLADGADIAYLDVEVVDSSGRVCPLADQRITFKTRGEAEFLGGYNSGRFNGHGKQDSVIHQNHVYAECGVNRVFLRSTRKAGEIVVTARMEREEESPAKTDTAIEASARFCSTEREIASLAAEMPQRLHPEKPTWAVTQEYAFRSIPQADAAKYTPLDKVYCKVLVNGQEPNTNGILSIVDNGSIYSPILYILQSMHGSRPQAFDYSFENNLLTITSGGHTVSAEMGRTHLLVDGEENLLNGQPYLNRDGVLIVEINAVISYIEGVTAGYDDKINVFRINW